MKLCYVILVILLSVTSGLAAQATPPNVVFLMTDDQRWDTLGCYGRTDVRTPNKIATH